jgi:hypothetical protein
VGEPDTAGDAAAELAGAALDAAAVGAAAVVAVVVLGTGAVAEPVGALALDDELLHAATVTSASTPAVIRTPRRTPARPLPLAVPAEPRLIFIGTSCSL